MKSKFIAGSLILSVILSFAACDEQAKPETSQKEVVSEKVETAKKAQAAVRDVSELAAIMRTMHSELKDARKFVADSEEIPDTVWTDFAQMVSAESTDGMVKDQDHFNGYAQVFLTRVSELKANPDVEKYNSVIDNCVACHQQYCQGPISKIKKLSLPTVEK